MIDDEVALRLGRLVIASARLELEIKQVAEFLGEPDVGRLSQLQQFRAIRRGATQRPEAKKMMRWATESNAVLKERGELVHGSFLGRWKGNEMVAAYIAHKRDEVVDVDLPHLDNLVESAGRLAAEGREFSSTLFGEFIESIGGEYKREQ